MLLFSTADAIVIIFVHKYLQITQSHMP